MQVNDLLSFSLDIREETTDKDKLELDVSEFSIKYVIDVETLMFQSTLTDKEDASKKTFGRCIRVSS